VTRQPSGNRAHTCVNQPVRTPPDLWRLHRPVTSTKSSPSVAERRESTARSSPRANMGARLARALARPPGLIGGPPVPVSAKMLTWASKSPRFQASTALRSNASTESTGRLPLGGAAFWRGGPHAPIETNARPGKRTRTLHTRQDNRCVIPREVWSDLTPQLSCGRVQ
jgi:hypothetical protein